MTQPLPLFDALTDTATEAELAAAVRELVAAAHACAFCRETLLMLAENYLREAEGCCGPRATALRRAAHGIGTG